MMEHIKDILKADKVLSDIYRSLLEQDLAFYRGLLLRHKDNKEISDPCISICKGLMKDIKDCRSWNQEPEKTGVAEYVKKAACN